MKSLFTFTKQYYTSLNKTVFLYTSLLVAALIVFNYTLGIESRISDFESLPVRVFGFFLLYVFAFISAYWIHFYFTRYYWPVNHSFYWLLIIVAILFALKISIHESTSIFTQHLKYPWKKYWEISLDWPIKTVVMLLFIVFVWKLFRFENPVAGMSTRNFTARPYLILLLLMLPLLSFAATQSDFLRVYPKLQKLDFLATFTTSKWKYDLFYELGYGSDFFSIELFFRGLLVLGFVRYVGKDAILPMAAFYCTIHFGKPLFECISSYFGGIILGVIVYRTQSIWGGLITHLGIAWLMEVAGAIGARISDS
jgi:hypothetical protein